MPRIPQVISKKLPLLLTSLTLCLLPATAPLAVARNSQVLQRAPAGATQAIAQAQTQALTIYQPLQPIQWEGPYMSRKGVAYYALEPLVDDQVSLADIEAARAVGDLQKQARFQAKAALVDYFQDDYFEAIKFYKDSLETAKTIGDHELEASVLAGLGLIQVQKGYYIEGIDYLLEYWQLVHDQGDRRAEELALGNLGNAYFGSDLYLKAIETHQRRLTLARQLGDRKGEAKALGDLGLVYQALGDYSKAIDYEQRQLDLSRQTQDLAGQKMALANLGVAYHILGDYTKAIAYQQERLTLAQQTKDLKAEAEARANLGGAYYFLGDYDKAIAFYDQGWTISWEQLHDADILYGIRGNQALVYFQKGDYKTALKYYNDYFIYVSSRNNRRWQGVAKNNVAALKLKSGDVPAAEAAFREAIAFWESLRSRLGSNDAYKVSIFETQNAPYLNLQALLLAQNKPEAALEIAERSRARAFAELVSRRLSERGSKPDATHSRDRLLDGLNPPPPTIDQIKQIAKTQKATLIVYSILSEAFKIKGNLQNQESTLLIWVVKPSGEVTLRQSDLKPLWQQNNQSLADLVTVSRQEIGVRGRGLSVVGRSEGRQNQATDNQFRQLYRLLIQPIADLLPTDPNARLIFFPQRSLFLVPFAALQDNQGKYLIEQHTLSIAPSLQVLSLTQQQRQTQLSANNRLSSISNALVVGNPTMPQVTVAVGQPPEQLPSLPGAEREARAIAGILKTQAITGAQATKAAVTQRMAQARFIHLATHGLLDDFTGLGVPGAIALAPAGKDNGLLTASEILDLKLNAELVVLSACDTGRGRITGDGVIGLSRSLIAAGAPSVIVSLWSVPDAPTASLMTEFYQNLQRTPDKAQALRQAMLTTLKQYPNPVNWAAFSLVGESD